MNPQLFSKNRTLRALNIVDSPLTALKAKGNLGYANGLYNPGNFFEEVLRERLEMKAETLNVAQKVYFLGFQPTDVVKGFLSISSVVWIPMSGFVVFEAAAFRAPIVAFDIERHHEFTSNEINGLLVENRNFKEMAGVVIKMLDNPELARKFSESARDKLAKEYNPQTLKEKEIEIYKSILNTRAND